jgi:hypothetical protein
MKTNLTKDIENLQRELVSKRVNINNKVLYRAFMMPEDCMQGPIASQSGLNDLANMGNEEGRRYPTPAYGLMPPFKFDRPKTKGKKKKRVRKQ